MQCDRQCDTSLDGWIEDNIMEAPVRSETSMQLTKWTSWEVNSLHVPAVNVHIMSGHRQPFPQAAPFLPISLCTQKPRDHSSFSHRHPPTHATPRNVEPYTFITLFSVNLTHTHTRLRYVTLELPLPHDIYDSFNHMIGHGWLIVPHHLCTSVRIQADLTTSHFTSFIL